MNLIEKYCVYCNKMFFCTDDKKKRCTDRKYKRDLKLKELK